ncbi:mitochondrial transcription termination factor 3 [Lycorma delicatula]|uniref:mitochondrial transcription termination factor 3 n=1 Tax=Lycorma delicatula TaxID=130591 RepID=UPI003F50FAC6
MSVRIIFCSKGFLKFAKRVYNNLSVQSSECSNNWYCDFLHITPFKRNYCNVKKNCSVTSEVITDVNKNKYDISIGDEVNKFTEINILSDAQNSYPAKLNVENVSDYAPAIVPSFNLAAYVNNSPTLQEFVKLGVKLYKLEKQKDVAELILKLDFEDIKHYLTFLHDNGVTADQFGEFISRNPRIFNEDLANLQIRINYLSSKKFTSDMIARIITRNPEWLSVSTKDIDFRMGYFQLEFKLNGNEARYLAVKQPKLITYNLNHVRINTFSLKEEMGFNPNELKKMLLNKPLLFTKSKKHILERFNYLHNVMKLSHELISSQPEVLTCRVFRLQQRHKFLESLGRAQFNPTQPGYVSLKSLISGDDSEFCRDVAKSAVSVFNMFQKTL